MTVKKYVAPTRNAVKLFNRMSYRGFHKNWDTLELKYNSDKPKNNTTTCFTWYDLKDAFPNHKSAVLAGVTCSVLSHTLPSNTNNKLTIDNLKAQLLIGFRTNSALVDNINNMKDLENYISKRLGKSIFDVKAYLQGITFERLFADPCKKVIPNALVELSEPLITPKGPYEIFNNMTLQEILDGYLKSNNKELQAQLEAKTLECESLKTKLRNINSLLMS